MGAGDSGQEPQAASFHKSLSRIRASDSLALAPLHRAATTLQDMKRNSKTLLTAAQNQAAKLQNGLLTDDWALLRRVGTPGETRRKSGGMRRVSSEANFQRGSFVLRAPRLLTAGGAPPAAAPEGWDWLAALNNTIQQARTAPRSKFQLPQRGSVEVQARQLVHSASTLSLQSVKDKVLQAPREALSTAQQTLGNCQQNLQTLQVSLKQGLAEGRNTLGRSMQTLGEPGSPSSSGRRLAALLNPARQLAMTQQEQQLDSEQQQELFPPWALLTGALRGRDATALEPLTPEGSPDGAFEGEEPSTSGRPWGPFQREAAARRQGKRGGTSSLREEGRRVTIVTTASLPWMTGTAVNPLLRAAYLARDAGRQVTLMIPWLAKPDQAKVYPNSLSFDTPEQQEEYVRDWVKKRTGFDADFRVTFYPGRYAPEKCSILPVGDPTQYVPDHEADVAILEEPEHLNWFHHGRRWTDKFNHVVGVVHTNYLDYARREEGGDAKEWLLRHINNWVCRVHCHKVVKLSDAVQPLPKQTTEFVHGVAESFLRVGEAKCEPPAEGEKRFTKGAYFIGKVVWAKGYTELLDLMSKHGGGSGDSQQPIPVDCYGTGEDLDSVREESGRRQLGLHFHGAKDHLDTSMHEYQLFINPSTSDVVATTTAEALAMGKWVVCADHPSNQFFSQFRNCLIYKSPEEFSEHVEYALRNEPAPMVAEERAALTWEAATERFLDITELTDRQMRPGPLSSAVEGIAWAAHNALTSSEQVRSIAGAGAHTRDNPQRLTDYQPRADDLGGLFDNRSRAQASHLKLTQLGAAAAAEAQK